MRQFLIDVRENGRHVAVISAVDERFTKQLEIWAKDHGYTADIRTGDEGDFGFRHK